jgi:N-acylglucosamine-6-phosphate 2-epimerase
MDSVVAGLRGGLIVSAQVRDPASPLNDPETIARLAMAAVDAGAVAIRAGGIGGVPHLRAVRSAISVPLIGLRKVGRSGVYITPTVADAIAVADSGAEIIAVDGTGRPRPDGNDLPATIRAVHERGKLVLADVANYADGIAAAAAGADLLATTLSGYVGGATNSGPDLDLVAELAAGQPIPVLAEGRYHEPAQARMALDRGAYAVVIGTAITDPGWLTGRFLSAMTGRD